MIPDILQPAPFAAAQQATLEAQRRSFPARSWWPSLLGWPCDRRLVWAWTRANEQEPVSYVLESVFHEGKLHEGGLVTDGVGASVYDRLQQMGFEVYRQYPHSIEWRSSTTGAVIAGKPDGALRGYQGTRFPTHVPFDAKGLQSFAWERLDSYEQLCRDPSPITRGYAVQGNLYAFLDNAPVAGLVLKNKGTGLLKPIFWELDYEGAEAVLSRVERLQPLVDRREDPPPIAYDEAVCGKCPFEARCFPARDLGAGVALLDADEELLADLERRDEIQPLAREYDQLDKAIKKQLRRLGTFEAALLGPWMVERTERTVKGYTVDPRTDVIFKIARVDRPKQITTEVE